MMLSSGLTRLHFPALLYQVITREDPSIIAWESCGSAFRIVDAKRFRSETIAKYFQHGNMSAFQRQLNLYGFRCPDRLDQKGVYSHPDFIQGNYEMARNIRRKKTWPTKKKPQGGPDPVTSSASRKQQQQQQQSSVQEKKKATVIVPSINLAAMASRIGNVTQIAGTSDNEAFTVPSSKVSLITPRGVDELDGCLSPVASFDECDTERDAGLELELEDMWNDAGDELLLLDQEGELLGLGLTLSPSPIPMGSSIGVGVPAGAGDIIHVFENDEMEMTILEQESCYCGDCGGVADADRRTVSPYGEFDDRILFLFEDDVDDCTTSCSSSTCPSSPASSSPNGDDERLLN